MQKKEREITASEAIAELRKKKGSRLTAAEVAAVLEKDPGYIAMRMRKEQELATRSAFLRRDEEPLILALKDVGWDVDSVWDLMNASRAYPEAIPILLEHLKRPYHPRTREGIARALTVRSLRGKAWDVLHSEFLKEIDLSIWEGDKWLLANARSFKGALANALSFLAEKENVEDILELVQDKRHGENRIFLVQALARFLEPRVESVLEALTHDKEVAHDAEKALNKIKERLERKRKD